MRNWKTSTIAILTALIALMTGAKEYLQDGQIPDIGLIAAALTSAWGLWMAKDHDARL
jgi:hypothetical protein